MRKKLFVLLLAVFAFTMTACGNPKDSAVESVESAEIVETADSVESLNDESDIAEIYGVATLGDYKNLTAEKMVYEISEESISEEIESMVYDYAEYNEVSRPSQSGDLLLITMTASNNGETVIEYTEEDEYYIYLGYGEMGNAVDQELTGVSAGNELSFSVTYDEDYEIEEFAGAKIDFQVNVLRIEEEIIPELTDSFIVDTFGYESRADLEESIRQEMESENESNSSYELRESLIQQVVDNSEVQSYSQDLYDGYAAGVKDNYESYAGMFGFETVEEVYEMFEMTEEDVEEEILSYVQRAVIIQTLAEKENLFLTEEEYEAGLNRYTEEQGYEDVEGLIADYGEETMYAWILEDKVLDFLEENATITEVKVSAEEQEEEFLEEE